MIPDTNFNMGICSATYRYTLRLMGMGCIYQSTRTNWFSSMTINSFTMNFITYSPVRFFPFQLILTLISFFNCSRAMNAQLKRKYHFP